MIFPLFIHRIGHQPRARYRHAETPACTRLQADLSAAQLRALRPARRDWSLLERIEKRMGPRPSEWPMRSRRSPTAAWTACGRRTVEVSQACRHVSGAATAKPVGPFTCARVRVFNPLLDGGMEIERLHAPVQVAPWHTLMGAVRRSRRGEAFKTPSGEF